MSSLPGAISWFFLVFASTAPVLSTAVEEKNDVEVGMGVYPAHHVEYLHMQVSGYYGPVSETNLAVLALR